MSCCGFDEDTPLKIIRVVQSIILHTSSQVVYLLNVGRIVKNTFYHGLTYEVVEVYVQL